VLKKLGIVAATATAGMLALSPLAFAQTGGFGFGSDDARFWFVDNSVERSQSNECSFDQDGIVVSGAVGVLGSSLTQDSNNNCVNVGDDSEIEVPAEPAPVVVPEDDAAPVPGGAGGVG